MKFNGYCPLLKDEIHEGVCIEINLELSGGKQEEYVIHVRKKFNLNDEEMECVCKNCPNYPFE